MVLSENAQEAFAADARAAEPTGPCVLPTNAVVQSRPTTEEQLKAAQLGLHDMASPPSAAGGGRDNIEPSTIEHMELIY